MFDYFMFKDLSYFYDETKEEFDWYGRLLKYDEIMSKSYFKIYDNAEIFTKVKMLTHCVMEDAKIINGMDNLTVAKAIHDFGKSEFKYARDPYLVEWFVSPTVLLGLAERNYPKYANCNDHAPALAIMLSSVGIKPYFIYITNQLPLAFHHVIAGMIDKKKLYPMETTVKTKDIPFGQFSSGFQILIKSPHDDYGILVTNEEVGKKIHIKPCVRIEF